ncbi:hypothetical protein Ddye_031665 [Dipteronia dyeriana]|uniref:RNA polymerase II C-terminal domain phosphatase-like n=1 Tax=Dipteronia dyeriana TaxID=168575 RepID=A0AAD9WNW0_9ROSI|nr:hypothetical protein Ddye_031665 [Dipteronia dyeriana]
MVAVSVRPPTSTHHHHVRSKITPTSTLHRSLGLDSCSKAPRIRLKIFDESISLGFNCKHSPVINGVCLHCGRPMASDYGIRFDYIFDGLRLSLDEISRLKVANSNKLFAQKKLHLVLDLDHTLLHSKAFKKLTPDELYLMKQTDSNTSDGSLFVLDDAYLVKLRPFVRIFLEEASSMFEIYVCSMGSRYYVKKVATFLDPEGKYFDSRCISREDFKEKSKKNLELVLGREDRTIIIDDTKSVWSDHLDNLITVQEYNYFTDYHHNCKSYVEMKTDEIESEGELQNVLEVLRRIHGLFFDGLIKDIRCLPFKKFV